jgi:hypothetical protein
MKTILTLSSLILLLLTFSNCSKENSSKWLLADVYIVEDSTGLPLANREITLFYWYDGIIGETQDEKLSLGKTDKNGYLKVEEKVTNRMDGFQIGTEVSGPNYNYFYKKVSVSVKKKNKVYFTL